MCLQRKEHKEIKKNELLSSCPPISKLLYMQQSITSPEIISIMISTFISPTIIHIISFSPICINSPFAMFMFRIILLETLFTKVKPTHNPALRMGFRVRKKRIEYKILIQIEPKVKKYNTSIWEQEKNKKGRGREDIKFGRG